jgi:cell division septation protein DedD
MSLALVAVVVLALCAISFWLGRQSVPAMSAGVLEAVPSQTETPVLDGGDVESELTFFDRLEKAPELSAQGDERTVKPAEQTPAPSDVQPAAPKPTVVAQARPDSVAEPVAAPPQSQVAQSGNALPGATGGSFQVQVLATTEREAADAMVSRLKSRGFPAHLSSGEYKGQALFRVRVGGYPDKAAAQQVARAIQDREGLQTWVTR